MTGSQYQLLAADEPQAVQVLPDNGQSALFLTCDHAGNRIPRKLGSLGLSDTDLGRHIAWDIGAAAVAKHLAARLGAWLIVQTYSRLVIDCNRPPGSEESVVRVSEATGIPGNASVTPDEIAARQREIFFPYHSRIAHELDARAAQQRCTILIAMHSFTPSYKGKLRPWDIGILYNRDHRLADRLLPLLRAHSQLTVGDNEPYAAGDDTDYTIPKHGEQRGIPHVGIELRQDLIADAAGQAAWAERLSQVLVQASADLT